MTDTARTRTRTSRTLSFAAGTSTLIAAFGLLLGASSGTAHMMPWIMGIGVFFGLLTLAAYFFTRP